MVIQLFRIEYTPDNINDYAVNILAETGDAAIKKISEMVKKPITIRTIDTVCSGIQVSTDKVAEIIAAPLLKDVHEQLKIVNQKLDDEIHRVKEHTDKFVKEQRTYSCPYCDFTCTSSLGIASHKRHKHNEEWLKEKETAAEENV